MKNKINVIMILILFFITNTKSQDNANYFPHNLGDTWEYFHSEGYSFEWIQKKVIYDSTDANGNDYVIFDCYNFNPYRHKNYEYYIIDSVGKVFGATSELEPFPHYLIFDPFAEVGDIWPVDEDSLFLSKLISVRDSTIWEVATTIKQIAGFLNNYDPQDTLLILMGYSTYSKHFGLIHDISNELGGEKTLYGAIIDSVAYGEVTGFRDRQIHAPEWINLNQNYPNPFNPETIIEYELKKPGSVFLSIYNITGNLVVTLEKNARKEVGHHRVIWNGKNREGADVASGIYIYRLIIGETELAKKMVLIR